MAGVIVFSRTLHWYRTSTSALYDQWCRTAMNPLIHTVLAYLMSQQMEYGISFRLLRPTPSVLCSKCILLSDSSVELPLILLCLQPFLFGLSFLFLTRFGRVLVSFFIRYTFNTQHTPSNPTSLSETMRFSIVILSVIIGAALPTFSAPMYAQTDLPLN